jgi:hypothetical protein
VSSWKIGLFGGQRHPSHLSNLSRAHQWQQSGNVWLRESRERLAHSVLLAGLGTRARKSCQFLQHLPAILKDILYDHWLTFRLCGRDNLTAAIFTGINSCERMNGDCFCGTRICDSIWQNPRGVRSA